MTSNIFPIRPNDNRTNHQPIETPNRKDVRKLASTLFIALNVAPGKALILSLGHGNEKSNFEAIESWVEERLVCEQLPAGKPALQILLPALEAQLHAITEMLPQQ